MARPASDIRAVTVADSAGIQESVADSAGIQESVADSAGIRDAVIMEVTKEGEGIADSAGIGKSVADSAGGTHDIRLSPPRAVAVVAGWREWPHLAVGVG
ncbi:MAG TPA: hypothetical protein VKQ30_08950 [Ktedonobacterales bacterium]|nr:hypothetical protein [Ktedonobacterales bacterium]